MISRRKRWPLLAAIAVATLAAAEGNFSDFDDELMRGMDDSIKSFEPNIVSRNGERALADAQILWDGFKWTEEYFIKRGGAQDAVEISRRALTSTTAVIELLKASDFDKAAVTAREVARTCRSCHDIYKES